jgi:gliding motility-associated-like protein
VPCAGCLNPVITPEFGFTLYLTALDANGCEASDQIRITVEKPWRVYFPNIFSPNNDGFNDTFFPSVDLSQVVSINTFQIYDRWGEQVFQATNFQPNQPANGWDGTFRGQALDPGVYVFYAEIQFIDGEVELFEGGVTLVR